MQPMAVFGEARSLEQLGRYDDAREVYQNFIVNHPDSDWIVHAESAIKFLDMQTRAVNG
jgi:predicted Zn-dependent protease